MVRGVANRMFVYHLRLDSFDILPFIINKIYTVLQFILRHSRPCKTWIFFHVRMNLTIRVNKMSFFHQLAMILSVTRKKSAGILCVWQGFLTQSPAKSDGGPFYNIPVVSIHVFCIIFPIQMRITVKITGNYERCFHGIPLGWKSFQDTLQLCSSPTPLPRYDIFYGFTGVYLVISDRTIIQPKVNVIYLL